MKKIKFLIVAFCAILLCGCMKVDYTVEIQKGGDASLEVKYLISDDVLDQYGMTVDDLQESIEEQYDGENLTIEQITDTDGDTTYSGVQYSLSSVDLEEQLGYTYEEDSDTHKATLTIPTATMSMGISEYGYTAEEAEEYGFEDKLTIKMPGNIESAENGEISGSTVTFDMLAMEEQEVETLTVVSSTQDYMMIAVVAGCVAILAVLIIYAIVKGKKNKKKTENQTAKVVETANEEVTKDVEEAAEATEETTEEVKEEAAEVTEETVEETTEEVKEDVEEAAEVTEETVEETTEEVTKDVEEATEVTEETTEEVKEDVEEATEVTEETVEETTEEVTKDVEEATEATEETTEEVKEEVSDVADNKDDSTNQE